METLAQARQLAEFVAMRWTLPTACVRAVGPVTENIAALLVDSVLQAGLNYRSVVLPRVHAVAEAFPALRTMSEFQGILGDHRFRRALNWHHDEKPRRLREFVAVLRTHNVESVYDLRTWIQRPQNRTVLTAIRGIGPKTVDYLSRLLGLETVAVDRHALRLLRIAGVKSRTYEHAKRVIEFAADLLQISRWAFDRLLWSALAGALVPQAPDRIHG